MLTIGGYRCNRLKQVVNSGFVNFHTKYPKNIGVHAVTIDQLDFLIANVNTWEVEEGFPCSYRRPRMYLIEKGALGPSYIPVC